MPLPQRFVKTRPPKERIDEILKERGVISQRIQRYDERRDFLQLCMEIDYLRAEAGAREFTRIKNNFMRGFETRSDG